MLFYLGCLESDDKHAISGEEKRLSLEEEGMEAAIDMGDLVGLTINNEADISYDVSKQSE